MTTYILDSGPIKLFVIPVVISHITVFHRRNIQKCWSVCFTPRPIKARYLLHHKGSALKPRRKFLSITFNLGWKYFSPLTVPSGLPVSFNENKRFSERLIFTEERLKKKVFQSQDLVIKICRQMQMYSLWSGLFTRGLRFGQRFVFLGFFFFFWKICMWD